jgi:hypothetical protein
MKSYRLFIYLFLLLLAFGCECPPGADTPKEITPSEYAKITIFNAVYSHEYVDIETKYGLFLQALYFSNYSEIDKKIGSGNNLMKLINPEKDYFYLVPLYLKKEISYTAVVVGNDIDMSTILVENDYSQLVHDKQYVRVIQAYSNNLNFSFDNYINNNFQLGEYTDYFVANTGFNDILVKQSNNQILNYVINCEQGKIYTVILYKDPTVDNNYSINVGIIETDI